MNRVDYSSPQAGLQEQLQPVADHQHIHLQEKPIDENGVVSSKLASKQFSVTSHAQEAVKTFLSTTIEIPIQDPLITIKVNLLELISNYSNFRVEVTGTAAFTALGLNFFKELFCSTGFNIQSFPSKFNDIDIRFWVPYGEEKYLKQCTKNILSFLVIQAQKEILRQNIETEGVNDRKHLEQQIREAFKWNWVHDDETQLSMISFGKPQVDLIFCYSLKRQHLFTSDNFRLGLNFLDSPFVEILSDGNQFWQAMVDRFTKQLRLDDIDTVNYKGWVMSLSKQARGWTWAGPNPDAILLKKTLQKKNLTSIFEKTLEDHHQNDPDEARLFVQLVMTSLFAANQLSHELFLDLLKWIRSQSYLESFKLPTSLRPHLLKHFIEWSDIAKQKGLLDYALETWNRSFTNIPKIDQGIRKRLIEIFKEESGYWFNDYINEVSFSQEKDFLLPFASKHLPAIQDKVIAYCKKHKNPKQRLEVLYPFCQHAIDGDLNALNFRELSKLIVTPAKKRGKHKAPPSLPLAKKIAPLLIKMAILAKKPHEAHQILTKNRQHIKKHDQKKFAAEILPLFSSKKKYWDIYHKWGIIDSRSNTSWVTEQQETISFEQAETLLNFQPNPEQLAALHKLVSRWVAESPTQNLMRYVLSNSNFGGEQKVKWILQLIDHPDRKGWVLSINPKLIIDHAPNEFVFLCQDLLDQGKNALPLMIQGIKSGVEQQDLLSKLAIDFLASHISLIPSVNFKEGLEPFYKKLLKELIDQKKNDQAKALFLTYGKDIQTFNFLINANLQKTLDHFLENTTVNIWEEAVKECLSKKDLKNSLHLVSTKVSQDPYIEKTCKIWMQCPQKEYLSQIIKLAKDHSIYDQQLWLLILTLKPSEKLFQLMLDTHLLGKLGKSQYRQFFSLLNSQSQKLSTAFILSLLQLNPPILLIRKWVAILEVRCSQIESIDDKTCVFNQILKVTNLHREKIKHNWLPFLEKHPFLIDHYIKRKGLQELEIKQAKRLMVLIANLGKKAGTTSIFTFLRKPEFVPETRIVRKWILMIMNRCIYIEDVKKKISIFNEVLRICDFYNKRLDFDTFGFHLATALYHCSFSQELLFEKGFFAIIDLREEILKRQLSKKKLAMILSSITETPPSLINKHCEILRNFSLQIIEHIENRFSSFNPFLLLIVLMGCIRLTKNNDAFVKGTDLQVSPQGPPLPLIVSNSSMKFLKKSLKYWNQIRKTYPQMEIKNKKKLAIKAVPWFLLCMRSIPQDDLLSQETVLDQEIMDIFGEKVYIEAQLRKCEDLIDTIHNLNVNSLHFLGYLGFIIGTLVRIDNMISSPLPIERMKSLFKALTLLFSLHIYKNNDYTHVCVFAQSMNDKILSKHAYKPYRLIMITNLLLFIENVTEEINQSEVRNPVFLHNYSIVRQMLFELIYLLKNPKYKPRDINICNIPHHLGQWKSALKGLSKTDLEKIAVEICRESELQCINSLMHIYKLDRYSISLDPLLGYIRSHHFAVFGSETQASTWWSHFYIGWIALLKTPKPKQRWVSVSKILIEMSRSQIMSMQEQENCKQFLIINLAMASILFMGDGYNKCNVKAFCTSFHSLIKDIIKAKPFLIDEEVNKLFLKLSKFFHSHCSNSDKKTWPETTKSWHQSSMKST